MLRRSELPPLSELPELPTFDDDPALFDPSPEWFVPGLRPALREDEEEDDDDGLGFRALIERPEALSKAWWTTGHGRVRRAPRRYTERSPRSSGPT